MPAPSFPLLPSLLPIPFSHPKILPQLLPTCSHKKDVPTKLLNPREEQAGFCTKPSDFLPSDQAKSECEEGNLDKEVLEGASEGLGLEGNLCRGRG
ncbi:unnamed protein product [Moneuplotes crassus]|uniref:Uncharacterized protein n=1 Tax=Euplotes crassus TaxID=5936 RepID=A0AAD1X6N4_EUPCR|nr:unnamed protein product [Moneuplotes crassus]